MWPSYDGMKHENPQLKKDVIEEWGIYSFSDDGMRASEPLECL
jgi:hypothetical protein